MLYVFDWDGTLLDSTGKIVRCMKQAVATTDLICPEEQALREIIGLGLREAIQALFGDIPDSLIAHLQERYAAFYIAADQTPCAFYPGVIDTLERLRAEGHYLAVATGKSRRGLDRVLGNLQLQTFFDASRCADETRSKPHPQMLLELMGQFAVRGADTVMIGDTEFDVHMAHRAGAHSVAVSYGAHPPARLAACRPGHTIHQFVDLLDWQPSP